MADVIAQVASLPISEITIALIQQKLAVIFQEMFESFTEGMIVEWTKKVRRPAGRSADAAARGHWEPAEEKHRDAGTQKQRPWRAWGAHVSGPQRAGASSRALR